MLVLVLWVSFIFTTKKNSIRISNGKILEQKIFKHISDQVDQASKDLAEERGACPDAAEYGYQERFSNKTAIAPTASISIICGGASPGVEPIAANSYTHKTLSGSFNVRNRYLEEILESHGKNDEETWSSITTNQGSVSHLDFLTDLEKDVFKTAFELNQKWIIELSGDRTPYISQAQSVNLFLPADVHKRELHKIHFDAWKKGLKAFIIADQNQFKEQRTLMMQNQRTFLLMFIKINQQVVNQNTRSVYHVSSRKY